MNVHLPLQFPRKAQFLFQPAPYKIMHGGRGSSKSWDFVRALLTANGGTGGSAGTADMCVVDEYR